MTNACGCTARNWRCLPVPSTPSPAAARSLESPDVQRKQAEVVVDALGHCAELATRVEFRIEIAGLEARLAWKTIGLAGFIFAALKLIPPAY